MHQLRGLFSSHVILFHQLVNVLLWPDQVLRVSFTALLSTSNFLPEGNEHNMDGFSKKKMVHLDVDLFNDFLFQESCSISTLWSCLLPCTTPRTSPKAACRSWWLSSSCIWWSDPARRWGTMSSSPRTWAWSGELDSMATSSKKLLGNNLCC